MSVPTFFADHLVPQPIQDRFADARFLQAFHGWAAWFWVAMIPVSALLLHDSIQYLVALSVYAVITGHWGSWQAARAEVEVTKQAED